MHNGIATIQTKNVLLKNACIKRVLTRPGKKQRDIRKKVQKSQFLLAERIVNMNNKYDCEHGKHEWHQC